MMRALLIVVVVLLGALGSSLSQAGTMAFYQNFDIADPGNPRPGCNMDDFPGGPGTFPFPAGWLKRNVDNRTPAADVNYVNEAWEVREEFADVTNCAAYSTSWYVPAGAADDWTWTPPITVPASAVLSWRALASDPDFRDGYQVRLMLAASGPPTGSAGVIGNQESSSTLLFTVAAEEASWTPHTVSLSAYSGQQVYIAFRNNSVDMFLLLIDDVEIIDATPNLTATTPSFSSPYPRVAAGFPVNAILAVHAQNSGGAELTNVVATATIKQDGVAVGSPIVSNVVPSVAIGAVAPVTFPAGYTFASSNTWTIEYSLDADQTPSESNLLDNVIESLPTTIGANEFARHELPATSTLGIGARDGGEIGVQLEVLTASTIAGLRFAMNSVAGGASPTWPGRDMVANLRAFDIATGKPGSLLASTSPVVSTIAGGTYDVPFVGGPQSLAPGIYVVTVSEPADLPGGTDEAPGMPLFSTDQRFEEGTTWVNWPTSPFGDWANLENFGFTGTPNVSLISEFPLFSDGFDSGQAIAAAIRSTKPARPLRKAAPTQLVPLVPR